MNKLIFEKTKDKSNNKTASGFLKWATSSFSAISGGYGKGALPDGDYTVKTRNVVVGSTLKSGFKDKKSGEKWFIPIEPNFNTDRKGFGIHPDGGPTGTLGCIGLRSNDASRFWKKWNKTPLSSRPTSLIVK